MSRGLGARQRAILAALAQHRDHPPDYDAAVRRWAASHRARGEHDWAERTLRQDSDRFPEWISVSELAGGYPGRGIDDSQRESVRRAVRALEAAGLVQTRTIRRHGQRGQAQLGVRLTPG